MIRIGVTADLSANGSIHQLTFKRAIQMAYNCLGFANKGIELIWENDHATAEGGVKAAKNLIRQDVHFIVGHYASSAAKNALPFYEELKMPAFLPAATSDLLTETFDCAFRICGRDSDLADFIKSDFESDETRNFFIDHDGSLHGKKLSLLINQAIHTLHSVKIVEDVTKAHKAIFVGNFANSVSFINSNRMAIERLEEIYFTDDLVHPALSGALKFFHEKVFVFGYGHSKYCHAAEHINRLYYDQWGEYPFTYFLETYASLEIIDQLLALESNASNWIKSLHTNNWQTVLGKLSFDRVGESGLKRFAKWKIEDAQLVPLKNYNNQTLVGGERSNG